MKLMKERKRSMAQGGKQAGSGNDEKDEKTRVCLVLRAKESAQTTRGRSKKVRRRTKLSCMMAIGYKSASTGRGPQGEKRPDEAERWQGYGLGV